MPLMASPIEIKLVLIIIATIFSKRQEGNCNNPFLQDYNPSKRLASYEIRGLQKLGKYSASQMDVRFLGQHGNSRSELRDNSDMLSPLRFRSFEKRYISVIPCCKLAGWP